MGVLFLIELCWTELIKTYFSNLLELIGTCPNLFFQNSLFMVKRLPPFCGICIWWSSWIFFLRVTYHWALCSCLVSSAVWTFQSFWDDKVINWWQKGFTVLKMWQNRQGSFSSWASKRSKIFPEICCLCWRFLFYMFIVIVTPCILKFVVTLYYLHILCLHCAIS